MDLIRNLCITMWVLADDCRRSARADDRGAVTTEMAILIGLFSVAAVAIAGLVIIRATGWAEQTPSPGG